jgi:hypothetical protein
VRRGEGVRIEAKLACSYYLQVSQNPPQAMCIVPGSASPGDHFQLDQVLQLAIGQPVQFPMLYSSSRLTDSVGQTVEIVPEELAWLPPIKTVVNVVGRKRREVLPVQLHVELTQIGTLQLWCQEQQSNQRWKLEFDIRGSTQTDHTEGDLTALQSGIVDDSVEMTIRSVLQRTFGDQPEALEPSKVVTELTEQLQCSRGQWSTQVLREMAQVLMELQPGSRRSPQHEARWLNLLGFALRPGYGMAADDWRVAQVWKSVHGKLAFGVGNSRNEALILWRRIAGGFTTGQQRTIYQQIAGPLRQMLDPSKRAKSSLTTGEMVELLRLVGSLELLEKGEKTQLGGWALDLLGQSKAKAIHPSVCWMVGRLGARQPVYGPLNCVVDTAVAQRWIDRLLNISCDDSAHDLALMLCGRRVGDRYRDIDSSLQEQIIQRLEQRKAPEHYIQLVRQPGTLKGQQVDEILGESLPLGLQMRST